MIWANEVVAEHLSRAKFPCVYRVHEAPDLEGLARLVSIFEEFPWFGKIDPVGFFTGSQHALQQAVSASRGRAEGELVSSLVLRSMKRAVYREKNCGHYGLASATYCHFTSPIRRYPDLMVHRMLKAELFGRPEKFDQMTTNLGWICEHSSGMEREADDASPRSSSWRSTCSGSWGSRFPPSCRASRRAACTRGSRTRRKALFLFAHLATTILASTRRAIRSRARKRARAIGSAHSRGPLRGRSPRSPNQPAACARFEAIDQSILRRLLFSEVFSCGRSPVKQCKIGIVIASGLQTRGLPLRSFPRRR